MFANSELIDVLTLDAEGQLAFVQLRIIEELEKQSYTYAREKYCIEERPREALAMGELFEYIVGTQSGGLIAAMLSTKDKHDQLQYYSSDIQKLIEE